MTVETRYKRYRSYEGYESTQKLSRRLSRRRGSEMTWIRYIQGLVSFLRHLGEEEKREFNPDTALEFLKEEDVKRWINGFIDHLMSKGLAPNTINSHVYGVKKWLESNDLETDWRKVEMVSVETQEQLRPPTLEELRRIYRHAELREKLIMTICVSSGIRIGGRIHNKHLLALQLKEVDLEKEYPLIRIPPHKSKGRRGYVTFMSPEAKKLLEEYLEVRRSHGEELTGDSPVITKIYSLGTGKFASYRTVRESWFHTLEKAGLHNLKSKKITDEGEEVEGERIVLSLHSLRKYFKTTCIMNGVPDNLVERWMGHKGKYLDTSYFSPAVQSMLKTYQVVAPKLTVSETEELKRTLDEKVDAKIMEVKTDFKRREEDLLDGMRRIKEDSKRREEDLIDDVRRLKDDLKRREEETRRKDEELKRKEERWETQIREMMELVKEAMTTTKEAIANSNNHQ